jgi:hypothetical protein
VLCIVSEIGAKLFSSRSGNEGFSFETREFAEKQGQKRKAGHLYRARREKSR